MRVNKTTEYAIEVPGRGYIGWLGNVEQDPRNALPSMTDVEGQLENAQLRYAEMGYPEIGLSLRIVARTVTITRGEWAVATQEATA